MRDFQERDDDPDRSVNRIMATVRTRRGPGWNVRPGAEDLDGLRHMFLRGWYLDEESTSIYVGETAWMAYPDGWPDDAPTWIASGDLTEIVAMIGETY